MSTAQCTFQVEVSDSVAFAKIKMFAACVNSIDFLNGLCRLRFA